MRIKKHYKSLHNAKIDYFCPNCSHSARPNDNTKAKKLKVDILTTRHLSKAFGIKSKKINKYLKPLLLPEFDEEKIRSFNPRDHAELSEIQRKFLYKLKLILERYNTDSKTDGFKYFVSDLMTLIFFQGGFDDGLELTLEPNKLALDINETFFPVKVDLEGRRGDLLTWLVKYSSFPTRDCFDIGCALLAAAQENYEVFKKVRPNKIYGLHVDGHKMTFCSMLFKKRYITDLFKGEVKRTHKMHRLKQLSLAVPDERKLILRCLSILYAEFMELPFKRDPNSIYQYV